MQERRYRLQARLLEPKKRPQGMRKRARKTRRGEVSKLTAAAAARGSCFVMPLVLKLVDDGVSVFSVQHPGGEGSVP